MRWLFGSVEGLLDALQHDHGRKSPFAIALASVDTCEAFRRACRVRFGREPSEVGRFRGADGSEWVVTTLGTAAYNAAESCAIEIGATAASSALDGTKIVGCVALMHVYVTSADKPPKPDTLVDGISRAMRVCTCYGSLAFFALFLVAIVWETWTN